MSDEVKPLLIAGAYGRTWLLANTRCSDCRCAVQHASGLHVSHDAELHLHAVVKNEVHARPGPD